MITILPRSLYLDGTIFVAHYQTRLDITRTFACDRFVFVVSIEGNHILIDIEIFWAQNSLSEFTRMLSVKLKTTEEEINHARKIFFYSKFFTGIVVTEYNCYWQEDPDTWFLPCPRHGVAGKSLGRLISNEKLHLYHLTRNQDTEKLRQDVLWGQLRHIIKILLGKDVYQRRVTRVLEECLRQSD